MARELQIVPPQNRDTVADSPWLTDFDLHLFSEGTFYQSYQKMGAHLTEFDGTRGVHFAVWAPNAKQVSVVGNFNSWERGKTPLTNRGASGVWEGFVPGLEQGEIYKFAIDSSIFGGALEKADPFAFYGEVAPRSASQVYDVSNYKWDDGQWMASRHERNSLNSPVSIYEVHLGSWMRVPEEGNRFLSYRELATRLADYVTSTGFTHVELLPIQEHPFSGSWGYQALSYFAPTSRFGTPEDFMNFVDVLHQRGIGVILDWVPAHFPMDGHGLALFDGSHLFEHADPRQGVHPDWGTHIFNYGRREVSNFLISSALFWLEHYHLDGLRVDAVASMLYLDYSRKEGQWIPNRFGGRENIEAIEFIRRLNAVVYEKHSDVMMIAEESTAWPMVSRPVYVGGLGFGYKWNMGWMNDVLEYMSKDPVYRPYHHNALTFGLLYAFQENFILPLSHDEVVHGKGSLLHKMPGDDWQKFSNLRLLLGFQYASPGKKLLFMGSEFGQRDEWNHDESLDWHLLQHEPHRGLKDWVRDLNQMYRSEPALYENDFEHDGFQWIDCNDSSQSVIGFIRRPKSGTGVVVCIFNFTPVPRFNYRVGVPLGGYWEELLNSDAQSYGGSGLGNLGGLCSDREPAHGQPESLNLTLPPLSVLFFRLMGSQ